MERCYKRPFRKDVLSERGKSAEHGSWRGAGIELVASHSVQQAYTHQSCVQTTLPFRLKASGAVPTVSASRCGGRCVYRVCGEGKRAQLAGTRTECLD